MQYLLMFSVKVFIGFLCAIAVTLMLYKDRLHRQLTDIPSASRIKQVSQVLFWILLAGVFISGAHLFYQAINALAVLSLPSTYLLTFSFLVHLAVTLVFIYFFFEQRETLNYFRTHNASVVLANHYLQMYEKKLNSGNIQEAEQYLIKACEVESESVELWCRLAFFYEMGTRKTNEATKCMQKAKELVSLGPHRSNKKIVACYENYLGYILCNRGHSQKGLVHIKRSIDIDPNPGRIKRYKEKLAELEQKDERGGAIPHLNNDGAQFLMS